MATELWVWQNGTSASDRLTGAAVGLDGSVVLGGYTEGDWAGVNAGGRDWAAVKLDSSGNVRWKWQGGDAFSQGFEGVVMGPDGSAVLAGYTQSPSSLTDFAAVKLDVDGNELWTWQDATLARDIANVVAIAKDGSVFLAGQTSGDCGGSNTSEDFAASKLDANGTLLWEWQDGSRSYDRLEAAAADDNGCVVMAGSSSGEWSGPSAGGSDFAAVKLSPDGIEMWRWQDGTTAADTLKATAVAADGSVVLAGATAGSWGSAGVRGFSDFVAVKLDSDGKELWRWQDGTDGSDCFWAAVMVNDDSVMLVGCTDGVWADKGASDSSAGDLDFAVVKLDGGGTELWRWQGGSADDEHLTGIGVTSGGLTILTGLTQGTRGAENVGVVDFSAVMLKDERSARSKPVTRQSFPSPTSTPIPTVVEELPLPRQEAYRKHQGATVIGARRGLQTSSTGYNLFGLLTPAPSPVGFDGGNLDNGFSQDTFLVVFWVVLGCILSSAVCIAGTKFYKWVQQVNRNDERRRQALAVNGAVRQGPDITAPPVVLRLGSPSSTNDISAPSILSDGTAMVPSLQPGLRSRAHSPTLAGGDASGATVAASTGIGGESLRRGDGHGVPEKTALDTDNTVNVSTEASSEAGTTVSGINGVRATSGTRQDGQQDIDANKLSKARKSDGRGNPVDCIGVAQGVMEAAHQLAVASQFPGVSEAATLVSILVQLVTNAKDNTGQMGERLRQCRSIVTMLQRAAGVLKQVDDTNGEAQVALIEDVHDSINDLVDLIKTYQSRNKIVQVITSTLFKRRQEETDASIERAISRLQWGLQIQAGLQLGHIRHDVAEGLELQRRASEGSSSNAIQEVMAEARRLRRLRNLQQIDIPEDHVTITDEVMGKGGFGTVYIADYNGKNAAAKVLLLDHDLGEVGDSAGNDGIRTLNPAPTVGKRSEARRRAYLRELQAMIRLSSPFTVCVYGAITCRTDRLVLVMELLVGGDLRRLLKTTEEPIPEDRMRRIVGDICAGMAFLHGRSTVHGDLKSPNVLFDGAGRAKIGDFGTARWAQHTNSTGLATYTTSANQGTQMSLAWAAPEVLEGSGISYESDVFSFGVVMWEILTREIPWATEPRPRDIYIRVAFKGDRPNIPADTPTDIADVIRACWAGLPEERPKAGVMLEDMKLHGWKE